MISRLMTVTVALAVVTPALADWVPGEPHKMHFPQLPDPFGWDVMAVRPKVLADDWQCSESGPVTDIHFWGSWREDIVGPIQNIHLSIHANIPAGPGGFSRPGALLWQWDTGPNFQISGPFTGDQGWFDPNTGQFNRPDHQLFFQYNVEDIPQPFVQQVGQVYWLDISVTVADPVTQWGWKTSQNHFMDDAVWGDLPNPNWQELLDPMTGESLDMAFVITPAPGTLGLLGIAGLVLGRRRRR